MLHLKKKLEATGRTVYPIRIKLNQRKIVLALFFLRLFLIRLVNIQVFMVLNLALDNTNRMMVYCIEYYLL